MILQHINELVRHLNLEWFLQKGTAFEGEQLYNKKTGVIEWEMIIDPILDELCQEIFPSKAYEGKKDLISYCWDDTNMGSSELDPRILPVNSSKISNEIVELLVNVAAEIGDSRSVDTFLQQTIITVNDALGELQDGNNDSGYSAVLVDFNTRFQIALDGHFKNIMDVQGSIIGAQDHLTFNLNMEELTALICLLMDGDIINNPNTGMNKTVEFCRRHFWFWNQRKHCFTPATDLGKRLSDIRSGNASTAVQTLKSKLTSAATRI